MRVIEVDGTDTVPYPVASFTINAAQRVSVLVDWAQVSGAFGAVYVRVTGEAPPPPSLPPSLPWPHHSAFPPLLLPPAALTDMYPVPLDFVPPYEEGTNISRLDPEYRAVVQAGRGAGRGAW